MSESLEALTIMWTPEHTHADVYEQIALALEFKYFTNAWLQGKLSSADYLEYAEWREIDIEGLLQHWQQTGRYEF